MNLGAAIVRYADRVHRTAGTEQHVASPLGAWLLLALVAPAAAGAARTELEQVLGTNATTASRRAYQLLGAPHPALALAAAAWTDAAWHTPALESWLDALRPDVQVGPMPTQAEADAWAAEHTLGLIDRFPVDLTDVVVALASAIVTKISWQTVFDVIAADHASLPRAAGFDSVRLLLTSERGGAIVGSRHGALGVHVAPSRDDDLAVVSVIADPAVPAADVMAAAHPIALAAAADEVPDRIPLTDLAVGAGHSWTLSEEQRWGGALESHTVVLPAWTARTNRNLVDDAALGFQAAGSALRDLLPPSVPYDVDARQAALARFTRTGFEAAAVTAMGQRATGPPPEPRLTRVARIEFTHPYAVVAVARGGGPWDGLPVFSAWVTEAEETDADAD